MTARTIWGTRFVGRKSSVSNSQIPLSYHSDHIPEGSHHISARIDRWDDCFLCTVDN
ncbi:uncharacterized protein BO97DRAFT_403446 [Aspergillus homomorphus CBS 101889]|uniref:Uncharacterized protein n=1 Tax=Aspergillus homomorphus (strain CBS 101889) TaxID=1450537 RepID=A0A395I6Q2_ASPHC|nr:hypothetical protein BO97DRAFT_403446 [Aspergillus homomorphus CBS 101889]RAL15459.1 hypothetical protein BO97DRAFT_403446 [Aspergillus homomorphus CBS 101889]